MKHIFAITIIALFAFAASAQPAPAVTSTQTVTATQTTDNPNAAEITFENTTIDYGTIKQGADGNREFKFTNSGKEPLVITSCHGSCGCTVPTCPTEPIMPGKAGKIQVHYDTNRIGGFTKTVTVSSNAKNNSVMLKITGTVETP